MVGGRPRDLRGEARGGRLVLRRDGRAVEARGVQLLLVGGRDPKLLLVDGELVPPRKLALAPRRVPVVERHRRTATAATAAVDAVRGNPRLRSLQLALLAVRARRDLAVRAHLVQRVRPRAEEIVVQRILALKAGDVGEGEEATCLGLCGQVGECALLRREEEFDARRACLELVRVQHALPFAPVAHAQRHVPACQVVQHVCQPLGRRLRDVLLCHGARC
mmetsp:Transcript_13684/g.42802  ORF Transcript_13684/g.42802 Transcript_13684/m.42802 type:complete len:220 (+) Transcript_13684:736-1395(+)